MPIKGGHYYYSDPFGGAAFQFTATNSAPALASEGASCVAADGGLYEIWQIAYLFSAGTDPEATVNMWVYNPALLGWSKTPTWTFKYAADISDEDSQVLQIPPIVGTKVFFQVSTLTAGSTLKISIQGISPQ